MKNLFKILFIITLFIQLGVNCLAQDESTISPDALMGLSIQKYLEGDIPQAITHLDKLLTLQPDNERARKLLKKASDRMSEITRTDKNYENGLKYLKIAAKHLLEKEKIMADIDEFEKTIAPPAEGEQPAETQKTEPEKKAEETPKKSEQVKEKKVEEKKPEPAKTVKKSAPSRENRRKIRQLSAHIKNLETKIRKSSSDNQSLLNKIEDLNLEKKFAQQRLDELKEQNKVSKASIIGILVIIIVSVLGALFLYLTNKKENIKLIKNMLKERRIIEELKVSYNKDTEKLSQKLTQYGKSYQRAEELEKNWGKLIEIIERVTKGGSTKKLVLPASPDGRKAVTGVDPRPRARADSVEVIEEIFMDSPKAPEMLIPFLDDPDNRTRANAAKALYRYDPEKSLVVLDKMANSEDKWMRLSSAWALGEIGESATSKILERLLDDPDQQVKNRARLSLEKILHEEEEI